MPPAAAGRGNPAAGCRVAKLAAGEHCVSADPGLAIATVLGSCVAACIRDPVAAVGGMNHFMLPTSDTGAWGQASRSLRYGNFAMERLINDLLMRGARRERLEAKVFGGARLLADLTGIGERNAAFVRHYLEAEGLALLAADLLGTEARRLIYMPVSGRAFVASLAGERGEVAAAERRYRSRLPALPPDGGVELFA